MIVLRSVRFAALLVVGGLAAILLGVGVCLLWVRMGLSEYVKED